MVITLKHKIFAILMLIALAIVLVPMWVYDASALKIKLWGLPSEPSAPRVQAINQLPEIKVLDSNAQKNNPDAWAVQVGTFTNLQQAQQLVAQLNAQNLPTYIEMHNAQTIVYVGPELTQENLQKSTKILAQNFKITGNVVTFTTIPTQ